MNHAHWLYRCCWFYYFSVALYLVALPTVKSYWSKILLHRIRCMFWLAVIVPHHTAFTLSISDFQHILMSIFFHYLTLLSTHSCQFSCQCFGNWWPIPTNTYDLICRFSSNTISWQFETLFFILYFNITKQLNKDHRSQQVHSNKKYS